MAEYLTSTPPMKIEEQVCPKCGQKRPFDWFGTYRYCWKCRELHPEECANVTRTAEDEKRERKAKREELWPWL